MRHCINDFRPLGYILRGKDTFSRAVTLLKLCGSLLKRSTLNRDICSLRVQFFSTRISNFFRRDFVCKRANKKLSSLKIVEKKQPSTLSPPPHHFIHVHKSLWAQMKRKQHKKSMEEDTYSTNTCNIPRVPLHYELNSPKESDISIISNLYLKVLGDVLRPPHQHLTVESVITLIWKG